MRPLLLVEADAGARERGVHLDLREAPLEQQPYADASFAVVTSSFGLIFAPDPDAVVRELVRCLRPGGLLAFTAWPTRGYVAEMTSAMQPYLPMPPAGVATPFAWGDDDVVRQRSSGLDEVEVRPAVVPWSSASVPAAIDLCFRHSPAQVAPLRAVGE